MARQHAIVKRLGAVETLGCWRCRSLSQRSNCCGLTSSWTPPAMSLGIDPSRKASMAEPPRAMETRILALEELRKLMRSLWQRFQKGRKID